jgi:hypothetical protein
MGPSDAGKHAPSRGMAVWIRQHCIIHVPMQSQMHERIAEASLRRSPWKYCNSNSIGTARLLELQELKLISASRTSCV